MSRIESSSTHNTSGNTSHLTRRGKAALVLSSFVAGGVVSLAAREPVTDLFHKAKSNVEQADESGHYSQRDLFAKMQQGGGFDPSKVEVVRVGPGDYPELMATELGAKDVRLVASEISGQEGGDTNLHVGDQVVLPKDQLLPPEAGK